MLQWAAIFFVIAIVAAFLGFTDMLVSASSIAASLFFVFVVIAVVSLVAGLMHRRH